MRKDKTLIGKNKRGFKKKKPIFSQSRRGARRVAPNHQRPRDEGRHHSRLRQQTGPPRG